MTTNATTPAISSREKLTAASFFGVAAKPQSYLNILYLLLGFPLGIFYFTFLVTGVSVGIGTLIIWVGVLVLMIVFGLSYALLFFERGLANVLLGTNIPPLVRANPPSSLLENLKLFIADPLTWKGLLYLLLRFPLGIFSFVMIVTLFSASLGLMMTPLVYRLSWITIDVSFVGVIDTPNKALTAAIMGFLLVFVSFHIINWATWLSGEFTRVMLSRGQPTAPAATATEAGATAIEEAEHVATETPNAEVEAAEDEATEVVEDEATEDAESDA